MTCVPATCFDLYKNINKDIYKNIKVQKILPNVCVFREKNTIFI